MSKKVTNMSKCSKCSKTVPKQDLKTHECIVIKTENVSDVEGDNNQEIEFLESDYEANDADAADEITDVLTADLTETEVEQLLDVSIQILEKGEVMDSKSFWSKLMASFNKNERWPLFVIKAKLRQLREMFQNQLDRVPKKMLKKLVKLSALEKKNNLSIKGTVSSTSDVKNETKMRSSRRRNSDSASEDGSYADTMRWTGREIIQLIESYKRHIDVMIAASANKEKRKIWEKIAAEVQMSWARRCDPYSARMKMMNLKKTCAKHMAGGGRTSWPYFALMNQILTLEKKQRRADSDSDPEYHESTDDDYSEFSNKRFKGSSEQPEWFLRFRQDARRRHGEKMKIKLKLLDVLESFVDKMNK